MSPSFSFSAFLQSIMPAPVLSRSSFTIDAEIAISIAFQFEPFAKCERLG
jgi:hypothetical protein